MLQVARAWRSDQQVRFQDGSNLSNGRADGFVNNYAYFSCQKRLTKLSFPAKQRQTVKEYPGECSAAPQKCAATILQPSGRFGEAIRDSLAGQVETHSCCKRLAGGTRAASS